MEIRSHDSCCAASVVVGPVVQHKNCTELVDHALFLIALVTTSCGACKEPLFNKQNLIKDHGSTVATTAAVMELMKKVKVTRESPPVQLQLPWCRQLVNPQIGCRERPGVDVSAPFP